ncbi:MAG TPA: GNAT family N-acetyltransferase [Chloroflexota bacterium]|nr:GNAT family N-acetyltransferase [Chloroflexota bacterium]
MIRSSRPNDAAALTAVHNAIFPHQPHTLQSWAAHVDGVLRANGRAWTLTHDNTPIAYAAILPVPGLPGLVELEGFVAPAYQRRGYGTQLLAHIKSELAGTSVTQLSYPVPHLHAPAAHFLLKNNFFIEHEEQMMELSIDNYQLTIVNSRLPPFDRLRASLATRHLPLATAIPLFCQLYTTCFTGLPWNQPFTEAEVAATLQTGEDLLFFMEDDTPIGFVWLRPQADHTVQLEPIGVIPAKQGQGYGRTLLHLVLSQLAEKGVTAVSLGVWANNKPAVHLYHSFGFRQTESIIYLAYDLHVIG